MFEFSQTRTVEGSIPFKKVNLIENEPNRPVGEAQLVFELYMPTELAGNKSNEGPAHSERHADLIRLASCIEPTAVKEQPFRASLFNVLDYAEQTGPLFGKHAIESLRDWANAAMAALIAMRIQEYLNGSCTIAKVSALERIEKSVVTCAANGSSFKIYTTILRAGGDYTDSFKSLPIVRKIESDAGYFYAFMFMIDEEESLVALNVLSFEHELTANDFSVLQAMFYMDEDSSSEISARLKVSNSEESFYVIDPQADIQERREELENDDRDALTALVQALVISHLSGAHVDVFQGNESTGFLSFDSYLSWLWFDFSRKLSTVKIGYCEQCGRAYSLAGHRGVKRHYCSDRCKTDAKNERTRKETAKIRELFGTGTSVRDIANEIERPAAYVRSQLNKWTKLKHDLDEDIESNGFDSSALLKRCTAEKLDLNNLLNAKRKKQIQDYAKLKRLVK